MREPKQKIAAAYENTMTPGPRGVFKGGPSAAANRLRPVGASIALHLAVTAFFWISAPMTTPPPTLTAHQPVAIRIQETTVTRNPPKPRAIPTQPKRQQRLTKIATTITGSDKATHSLPLKYGDLFPQTLTGQGTSVRDSESIKVAPALSGQTQLVVSHIDVPLKLRTKNEQATAVARLVRLKDQSAPWMFGYVDGDPHLRAVLYETLRVEKTRLQIPTLFTLMESDELYFTLRQVTLTSPPPDCLKGDTQDIKWSKAKITVTRTMHVSGVGCPGGGLMLPDKHWEIAKRRDAQKLLELTSSAAFIGPIRNKIPAG